MSLAISPDGRTLAYLAHTGQRPRSIFVRRLDALEAHSLPGTDNARHLRFSPDSRWILYEDNADAVNKILVDGGAPSLVSRLEFWQGHGWGSKGDIVYSELGEIWRMRALGERRVKIAALDTARGQTGLTGPWILPDGDHVLYGIGQTRAQNTAVGIVSLADPKPRMTDLVRASPLHYMDGWLIYGRPDGTIAASKFDLKTGRTSGDPITLLDGVFWKLQGGVTATVSSNGSLIYLRGGNNYSLSVIDARGSPLTTNGESHSYSSPTWSPDAKHIAVEVQTLGRELVNAIWIYDVASGVFSRATSRVSAERPSWTADGK